MLDLRELVTDDIPGVDRPKGNDLARAAAVCLESQKHGPGVQMSIRGASSKVHSVDWAISSPQNRRTRSDLQEATEDGAAGIAILLAIREIGHTVILRSRKTTGIDYWLGDNDTTSISAAEKRMTEELQVLLEDDELIVRGRMEVSGILNGDDGEVLSRSTAKLNQTARSASSELPAYVIVVEFGRPLAEVTNT